MVQHTQNRAASGERSMSKLVEDATAQVSRLVRDEIRLARAEIGEKAQEGVRADLAAIREGSRR